MVYKLLAINPGSTSTKIGVYEDDKPIIIENLKHPKQEIDKYETIYDQLDFRKNVILSVLSEKEFNYRQLSAVVGRGGLLKPMQSGTYKVNNIMIEDLKKGIQGQHASNLGGVISNEIAKKINIPAFIVDPVVVDEMVDYAKISGIPELPRKSKFHALNQKAVAKRYADDIGKSYDLLKLIVVHLGGGVSVGAHLNGKVVDVNNALDGDGPFSPERSGGVPVGDLLNLCFSKKYTKQTLYEKIVGKGGFFAYLSSNNAMEIEENVKKCDEKTKLIYKAFIYQVAKSIAEFSIILNGKIDGIILTGGMAKSKMIVKDISEKISWISNVIVYPGEDELLALAQGATRVLSGKESLKEYK